MYIMHLSIIMTVEIHIEDCKKKKKLFSMFKHCLFFLNDQIGACSYYYDPGRRYELGFEVILPLNC